MTPKISVIIPNYNHARYLERRIDSVLNQTYDDIEVIILDDCSTDNSKEIIERYRVHQKVKHIVYSTGNSGSTFKQWVKGITLAEGDFIWIAESDDYSDPKFLEDLIANVTPATVLACCQSTYVDGGDKVVYQTNVSYDYRVITGKDFIQQSMINENAIYNASMCIWKKSCFEKISGEFLKYKFCGDWIFWTELITQGNILISGKHYNYYQKHDQTVSASVYSTGEGFREEMMALSYLSKYNQLTKEKLEAIVANKISQYSIHKYFIEIFKQTLREVPELRFESHVRMLRYLQLKWWVKKLIRRA